MEGTFAPAAEVLSSDIDTDLPRSPALTEIINFIHATEYGVDRISSLPIGRRLACELRQRLVVYTPSDGWQAGKVRQTQVFIGPYPGCRSAEARYVPPPPGRHLDDGLSAWENRIHADIDIHPVVRVAASHYQFEALDPSTDSNGRIGRLLAILQLIDYCNQAANVAVGRLVDAGVLKEVTGHNDSRVFQASEVLDILFRPGPTP